MKFIFVVILLATLFCTALGGHVVIKRSADSRCDEVPGTVRSEGISCAAFFQHYTYLKDNDSCVQFIYGGCGGTANNFQTQQECETACKQ